MRSDRLIPPAAQRVTDRYVTLLNERLPDTVSGLYLYGSIAMGDFHPRYSDIDAVAVIEHELSPIDIKTLLAIHHVIERKFGKPRLSVIYVQPNEIGLIANTSKPSTASTIGVPYYHDSNMHARGEFELNQVTWFELKRFGITVFGQSLQSLVTEQDADALVHSVVENANSYWKGWYRKCNRVLSRNGIELLLSKRKVAWGVLGIARIYYTICEHDVTTKTDAAVYALKRVPERWRKILREALRARDGGGTREYFSLWKRRREALQFILFMIEECNRESQISM